MVLGVADAGETAVTTSVKALAIGARAAGKGVMWGVRRGVDAFGGEGGERGRSSQCELNFIGVCFADS